MDLVSMNTVVTFGVSLVIVILFFLVYCFCLFFTEKKHIHFVKKVYCILERTSLIGLLFMEYIEYTLNGIHYNSY